MAIELHYYAGDLRKYGCSCCSNLTMRWRVATFRWLWMARLARWWIKNGPVFGMQVMIGGRLNPRLRTVRSNT